MDKKRREFLRLGGNLAAGLTLAPLACKLMPKDEKKEGKQIRKLESFGLQLYCVRNLMAKDPQSTLKAVSAAGYKFVESFDVGNNLGIFAGMGNTGFSKFIGDLGMKMHSVHTNVFQDYEKKVNDLAAIGVEYIIWAWEGPGKTLDDYRKYADDFNKMGEYAKQHGVRFAFHNHDFSFKQIDGIFPQDILIERTNKDLVDFQIDYYWVVTAGQDPIAWMNKNADRYKLTHFKDRAKDATTREGAAIVELGTGNIDFQSILNKTKTSTIKYHIVDQDTCNDRTDPFKCITADADFMKTLVVG